MAKKEKYNWDIIKKRYVIEGKTMREIAAEFGMAVSTVARKSKKEGWVKERLKRQKRIANKTLSKSEDRAVEKNVNDRERIRRVATAALDELEVNIKGADVKYMRIIAGAIKELRDVLGVKSDEEIAEHEARLALLKKKTSETTDPIIVQLSADVKDFAE